jgi:hypothetical protein
LSKYLISKIDGLLLDVAFDNWSIAANLPIESFVSIKEGEQRVISQNDVWKETNKTFRKMLRGKRIYKGYGKNDSDFKGK